MKTLRTSFVPQTSIVRRKSEHLRIVAEEDVLHSRSTLFEDLHLEHDALPELDATDLELHTPFFGKTLDAPLMITSMTGGAEFAREMNEGLARTASEKGLAFSVGSQRVLLRYPEMIKDFAVRACIPDGVLLGNIGGVQLKEYSIEQIAGLADMIEADGLCVHLNAGQELVQGEGQQHGFSGVLDGIAHLVDRLDGRVLVKETGAGMGPKTLKRLAQIGVQYIDVAGSGGTSWTKVEKYRAPSHSLSSLGEVYQNWGIPTAVSLAAARRLLPEKVVIVASGGIQNGLEAAKAFALGAHLAGFARSVLLSFIEDGPQGAHAWIEAFLEQLRAAMILTGSRTPDELQSVAKVVTGGLKDYLSAYKLQPGDIQ
ncbi:type 2 isopentenyl-diphosphate Delta-isomerase [bacterium]|nr:type 2 isopentenyl-diphosphate Delta-isomerase [bacterium]